MDSAETPAKIAGIYRVSADGSIEALETIQVGPAERATMFLTYEGVVIVIGQVSGG